MSGLSTGRSRSAPRPPSPIPTRNTNGLHVRQQGVDSKFSRKANQAIKAVKTASRLSNSDATEAGVWTSPSINRMGPRTPPLTMAPTSHGASRRVSGASVVGRFRRRSHSAARPVPEPRYSSPASSCGAAPASNSLANGELAPNRSAATSANPTPRRRATFVGAVFAQ